MWLFFFIFFWPFGKPQNLCHQFQNKHHTVGQLYIMIFLFKNTRTFRSRKTNLHFLMTSRKIRKTPKRKYIYFGYIVSYLVRHNLFFLIDRYVYKPKLPNLVHVTCNTNSNDVILISGFFFFLCFCKNKYIESTWKTFFSSTIPKT